MPLETATYISDLVSTNPAVADATNQGDDHLRLIKATIKATFPNVTGPVTRTQAQLNIAAGGTSNVPPANPPGTTSTTGVHMGLGSSWSLTPVRSGTAIVVISGLLANSTGGSGAAYHLRYGTGAAPANGAAPAGSAGSASAAYVLNAGVFTPFSTQFVITGLVIGTPVWFDLLLASFNPGLASASSLTCSAAEL